MKFASERCEFEDLQFSDIDDAVKLFTDDKVREYLEEDKRGHGGSMANMLIHGKVLMDKHNIVDKLREEAKAAKKPYKSLYSEGN